MNGNQLMIYGVISNHEIGLYRDEIIKEITYKDKQRISNRLLSKTLQELEELDLIEVERVGRKKFYRAREIEIDNSEQFFISVPAIYSCIKGEISTEELRLYLYIRYLHHLELKNSIRALNDNQFHANQKEIAKDLNLTRSRVSQMIRNLLDQKIMTVDYREYSKSSNWDYNVYRLIY